MYFDMWWTLIPFLAINDISFLRSCYDERLISRATYLKHLRSVCWRRFQRAMLWWLSSPSPAAVQGTLSLYNEEKHNSGNVLSLFQGNSSQGTWNELIRSLVLQSKSRFSYYVMVTHISHHKSRVHGGEALAYGIFVLVVTNNSAISLIIITGDKYSSRVITKQTKAVR